jgi:DNA polymerase-3 subunit gamma/tau
VKFIFATTEIRKVPVTILSRCQRYDLRRIEPEVMMAHLRGILSREGASVSDEALALITRAAEGSVRDALSLLDQAIAQGTGETGADQVRAMLGLADRGRVLDLFDQVMRGDAAGALAELSAQYADGADPLSVLRDLAEVTHWISVLKIAPQTADDPTVPPDERDRGLDMAGRLPMRALSRMWQMLLKALDEVALAPNAMMAAEMAVIRLTHVADLPDPETLVRRLHSTAPPAAGPAAQAMTGRSQAPAPRATSAGPVSPAGAATALALAPETVARLTSFDQVVALIRERRDMKLLYEVETCLRLVQFAPGRIEFQPTPDAAPDLAARLSQRLQGWTGGRWGISVAGFGGGPTIAEARGAERARDEADVLALPLVQAVLSAFPGAKIAEVRQPQPAAEPADPPEAGDDWDPFEDD